MTFLRAANPVLGETSTEEVTLGLMLVPGDVRVADRVWLGHRLVHRLVFHRQVRLCLRVGLDGGRRLGLSHHQAFGNPGVRRLDQYRLPECQRELLIQQPDGHEFDPQVISHSVVVLWKHT